MSEHDDEKPMSGAEVAKYFGEPTFVEKTGPDYSKMTKEEIQKYEEESTDIYRVAARVKNLARSGGASLTRQGEGLCNMHVHVLLAFYEFAETLDEAKKEEMKALIRKHENMPALVIAGAGLKNAK